MTYRVRENTRDLHGMDGKINFKNYYVYCSPEFDNYYEALKYAVEYDRKSFVKTWVDCLDTYEIIDIDPEIKTGFGWV